MSRLMKSAFASIRKPAAYVILVYASDGHKETIGLEIGENESSKHWPEVFDI